MIGILFHGPEVFDSGWAARFMQAFPDARTMLAGTMSRTALFDSGLQGVEAPGLMCSPAAQMLAVDCEVILLATRSKSTEAGLALGKIVAQKMAHGLPFVQAECTGLQYAVHAGSCPVEVVSALQQLGFAQTASPEAKIDTWREGTRLYRRMHTAQAGDYVLVNGIFIGHAQGGEVVLATEGRQIVEVRGVDVKEHGLEKIERFGGVNLATVKLASTAQLRSDAVEARIETSEGKGVVFIDHAGMHVYELTKDCAGAVTVGDDTTAVTADILRRFGIPVVGVVDGDGDKLHTSGGFAPGSVVLTVKADDEAGLRVQKELFAGGTRTASGFDDIKHRVAELLAHEVVSRADH
ncbi:MAG: DUF2117 domain-containing protein [Brachymonas sp.]|nr:DUF2117 domain-containing protein [Brachymonas sp.]